MFLPNEEMISHVKEVLNVCDNKLAMLSMLSICSTYLPKHYQISCIDLNANFQRDYFKVVSSF